MYGLIFIIEIIILNANGQNMLFFLLGLFFSLKVMLTKLSIQIKFWISLFFLWFALRVFFIVLMNSECICSSTKIIIFVQAEKLNLEFISITTIKHYFDNLPTFPGLPQNLLLLTNAQTK